MRITTAELRAAKGKKPIVMVTAYDAWMGQIVDGAVDAILVGDSLGMVVQGHENTLPVTLDEIVYHTRMVVRGTEHALVVADLPFMTYQASVEEAVRSGGRCLKEGRAQAVKVEGGPTVVPQVRAMVSHGIPVVGHLGLTPQTVHVRGGFKAQGDTEATAKRILDEAKALEEAGIFLLVLEAVPGELAKKITASISVPTIGIGAGADCDGQVQVFHDLFSLRSRPTGDWARSYVDAGQELREAVARYADEVRSGTFARD
jgi:3-methyl-2-oxobutanoate hydroxymethyltransferase